jgi:hypothetical protein
MTRSPFSTSPHERTADHLCHEQIALPFRKEPAVIESDSRGRDIGRPEIHGLFHAGLRRLVVVDRFAGVFTAVSDYRETIVLSLFDGIDFVATANAMLTHP